MSLLHRYLDLARVIVTKEVRVTGTLLPGARYFCSAKKVSNESNNNPNKSQSAADPLSFSGLGEDSFSPEDAEKVRQELGTVMNENTALQAKVKDYEDRYLRSLADSENMRTRLTKQINDSKLYGIQKFCKDLTEIEDVLQMALSSVPQSEISSNNHLKQLYEGISMTEARLLQVFKSHGLTQINPLNTKFDPNEHEAVAQQEAEGKESGTVIFVSKLGYKLHDRVIRPAVVGVAK